MDKKKEILRLAEENNKKVKEILAQMIILQKLMLETFNEDIKEEAANA